MTMNAPDKIIAAFQAQEVRGDLYCSVGDPVAVDVTERVLLQDATDIKRLRDDDYPSDHLCGEQADRHGGPFRVEVQEAIQQFFGVDDLSEITQDMVVSARQRLGIGEPKDYEVEVHRTVTKSLSVKVRAISADEAREKALESAGNHDFTDAASGEPTYEVGEAVVAAKASSRSRPR